MRSGKRHCLSKLAYIAKTNVEIYAQARYSLFLFPEATLTKTKTLKVYATLFSGQMDPVVTDAYQPERSLSSSSFSSGSLPIRAPLTLDDSDFESNCSSDVSRSSTGTDSGLESEGSVNGEECETVLARPFVAVPDEVIINKETVAEVESVENGECAPLVEVELPVVTNTSLRVTPIAQLSSYDDDDNGEEEEEEEILSEVGGCEVSGIVRVPSINLPESFAGAPRIKVSDVEEEELGPLMLRDSLTVDQSLVANDMAFVNDKSLDNFIEAENGVAGSRTDEGLAAGEYDVDEIFEDRVALREYSISVDTDVVMRYSQNNLNIEEFDIVKGKVASNNLEKECVELDGIYTPEGGTTRSIQTDIESTNSIMQRKLEVDTKENTEIMQGTSILVSDANMLMSSVEGYDNSITLKQSTCSNYLGKQNPEAHFDFTPTSEPASDDSVGNIEYTEAEPIFYHLSSDDDCEGTKILSVESSEFSDLRLLQETVCLENKLSRAILGTNEAGLFSDYRSHGNLETCLDLGVAIKTEATVDISTSEESKDASASNADAEGLTSVGIEQFMEQISALSGLFDLKGSGENSRQEQTVRSLQEKTHLLADNVKKQLHFAIGNGESDGSRITITSADESRASSLKSPPSFSSLTNLEAQAGFDHNVSEKEKGKIKKMQAVCVKFLRVIQRINVSFEDSTVSKVLCRLVTDIGKRTNQEFIIKLAKILAMKLEEEGKDDLDFSLNILVLGKSGVGKSATINSILGEMKLMTNAFEPATTTIEEVTGIIDGVKIRILDTPGLRIPMMDQAFNRKILSSIKRYMKKFPPDVILYVDRVDAQTRDLSDLSVLKSITSSLNPSIWQRVILTLTHAASAPLDGPSGSPLSYESFVAQKSHLFQQTICQAVGDPCLLYSNYMCPVSLIENQGHYVLPSGLKWRSQLLVWCFSLKVLSEVSSMSEPKTLFDHWKHFLLENHSQPLPHLLSSLLQSHACLKFPANWS